MDTISFDNLVEILGKKKATEFCKKFGGKSIYVPRVKGYHTYQNRNGHIYEDYVKALNKGTARSDIFDKLSIKYDKSQNRIRQIIREFE